MDSTILLYYTGAQLRLDQKSDVVSAARSVGGLRQPLGVGQRPLWTAGLWKMADGLLLRSSTALTPSSTSGHSVVQRFGEADDLDWWWQVSQQRELNWASRKLQGKVSRPLFKCVIYFWIIEAIFGSVIPLNFMILFSLQEVL